MRFNAEPNNDQRPAGYFPDAGVGVVVLPAGDVGQPYWQRRRHLNIHGLRRFFGGAAGCRCRRFRLHGQDSRRAITGITLFAGFASTVGWPLSAYLDSTLGWRGACITWAALHIAIGLPLNALLPRASHSKPALKAATSTQSASAWLSPSQQRRAAVLMAFVFAAAWFISTAMAAHLPKLLVSAGTTVAVGVGIAALVGPAQVAGRLIEFTLFKRAHPLLSARLATLAHPLGVLCLSLLGASGAAAFAVLHGLGNGILTIAIGTLPLLIFGADGYGQRQGLLMVPARIVQAAAPFLFGLAACTALVRMTADMKLCSPSGHGADRS